MTAPGNQLEDLVATWLNQPVAPEIKAMAEAVMTPHKPGVSAVLAYGSCLRGVATTDSLIDLYVLTRDDQSISSNWLSRTLCQTVPPNVYYAETEHAGQTYRAKYACLPLDLFTHKASARTSNPYFWARFSQPCALVYASDDETRTRVHSVISTAAVTMMIHASDLAPKGSMGLEAWRHGLTATYATELRSEGPDRARQIVETNSDAYQAIADALLGPGWVKGSEPSPGIHEDWAKRRRKGKFLSVARLLKAAFTFQGGADYLAWKIERHSGVPVNLTPWQRRHPILAGLLLLPKLLKSGAVK